MLTKDISDVLPPGQGFLRPYVEYASQCFDAPEIYHVGVGLTVFASAVAKHLACPWMAGRTLVPNLYTLLVGPSRSARKTGSMDAGISILQAVSNELVMPIPGSYEELVNQIRATPSGLLTYREFAHFLKTTVRGYGEPIRTILMDLYDWPPNRAYTRVLRKGKTVVEPPICLSLMSAIDTNALFAYCVDETTEILTASGWKRYKDLSVGEECYTLNHETGCGEWQRVTAVNVFEGHPQREMIRMEGRGHSSLSTLDHRWPVRSKGNSSWSRRWKTSETLNQADFIQRAAPDAGLPTTAVHTDAFVEIVAWAWTEGHWNVSNMLGLCQSARVNPAYCARIRAALTAHLGPVHEGSMLPEHATGKPLWVEDPPNNETGKIDWRLNQAAARDFLPIVSQPEKVVSLTWLRTLTKAQLDLFIDVSMMGDGHSGRADRLAQKSHARAEAFAFACILAGRAVSYCDVQNDQNNMREIGLLRSDQFSPVANAANSDDRPYTVERVTHDGPVWCPTTPNGSWLARRNGSVYWTGNTDLEEWTSGFFGRMIILYGERDVFRLPATWDAAANHLQAALHNYTFWPGWNPCGGFSPNAWAHLGNWAMWRDSTTNTFPPRVQTFVAGTATLAAKVALLYAADQGEAAAGPGWLISEESMRRAILFVDKLYLPSVFLLGEKLTNGPWERDRQKILDFIESRPQGALRRDILRYCKVSAPLLDDVTDTLKQEGTITQGQTAAGISYRRVRDNNGGGGGGGGGSIVPITSALNKTGEGEQ